MIMFVVVIGFGFQVVCYNGVVNDGVKKSFRECKYGGYFDCGYFVRVGYYLY